MREVERRKRKVERIRRGDSFKYVFWAAKGKEVIWTGGRND